MSAPKVNQKDFRLFITRSDNLEWVLRAEFKAGKDGDGLVLKGISHQFHPFARDVRVKRIYLYSHTYKGHLKDYYQDTGYENFSLNEIEPVGEPVINTKSFKVYPRDHFRNQYLFTISQKFIKRDLFGQNAEDLEIEQEYLFTSYGGSPAHEPMGILKASRFYPLLRFNVIQKWRDPNFNDKKTDLLKTIRVDYRFEFYMEQPVERAIKNNDGSYKQQIGIFKDHDKIKKLTLAAGQASTVFKNAEKPIIYSILGSGAQDGYGTLWDNIHLYCARTLPLEKTHPLEKKKYGHAMVEDQPPTPGTPYAIHIHWRWSTELGEYHFLTAPEGGSVFSGAFNTTGGLMFDPSIYMQNLTFAITDINHNYSVNVKFDDSIKNEVHKPPTIRDKGKYFTYFSLQATKLEDYLGFNGTFFPHGIFFSHNYDPPYSEYADINAIKRVIFFRSSPHRTFFEQQYFRSIPKQEWHRPYP